MIKALIASFQNIKQEEVATGIFKLTIAAISPKVTHIFTILTPANYLIQLNHDLESK